MQTTSVTYYKSKSSSAILSLYTLLGCLAGSIALLITAPGQYSHSFCLQCFVVFALSSFVTLRNNILRYRTLVIFEFLFILAFFMTNYVYPLFFYESDPYFSIFRHDFNEQVISKATAIATIGICSYNIGQFDNGTTFYKRVFKSISVKPVTWIDLFFLVVFFIHFFSANINYFRSGLTGGENGSFFMIFSIYIVFKMFKNGESLKIVILSNQFALCLILIYILLNMYIGNRGEPMYIMMSFVICYAIFIKKISIRIFLLMMVTALLLFFVVGRVRVSGRDATSAESLESRLSSIENVDNYLMYGEQLIINARSLYVLVDYGDKNGINFGSTWVGPICSVVPYLQGIVKNAFNLEPQEFSTTELTTYLNFGKSNADAFGLGTNIIGDIYICFGSIGVVIWMFLLGTFVKRMYIGTLHQDTVSQLIYCCLFLFSVYYTRAVFLTPLRTTVWVYLLYRLSITKQYSKA